MSMACLAAEVNFQFELYENMWWRAYDFVLTAQDVWVSSICPHMRQYTAAQVHKTFIVLGNAEIDLLFHCFMLIFAAMSLCLYAASAAYIHVRLEAIDKG